MCLRGPPQAAGGGALSRMPLAPGTLSAMSLIPSLPPHPCKEERAEQPCFDGSGPLQGLPRPSSAPNAPEVLGLFIHSSIHCTNSDTHSRPRAGLGTDSKATETK